MINFFDNDMREIWASRDSGSTFPISRVYFESIQVWPSGTPPTPTGYTFSVSPTALTTDDSAKTVYFTVITDSPQWSVTPSQSWITVNGITGDTLEVSIAANSGVTDRQGALVFSYEESSTGGTGYVIVDVTQEGVIPVPYIFSVVPTAVTTDNAAKTIYFTATTDSSQWTVSTPESWMHYKGMTALTNNQYVVAFDVDNLNCGSNNIIIYSSTDDSAVTPYNTTGFGVNIVSNTYYPDEGYGEIVFDGDVTSLGINAFKQCATLLSITIPDTVVSIGRFAFDYCTSLLSAVVPEGITAIPDYMFRYCENLNSVTIPDTVTGIGEYAFTYCTSLSSITIPDGITTIGAWAFGRCESLSSITIPDSITSIETSVFQSCINLITANIPNSVNSIGSYAFAYCNSLSTINYNGTVQQWNAISKNYTWHRDAHITVVHCTDGDVII